MNALDTNIWIYALDTRDPRKQGLAKDLIAHIEPLALPWQVGCEFLAAVRKLQPHGFDQGQARTAFAAMQTMADSILLPTVEVWTRGLAIQDRFGLSLWDSLLVGACLAGGVTRLYSEDFGTLGTIEGLQLVNPFV